tara:strand:+ start:1035 stop:1430 length:396 start_codon:yes stop_codon:yes gene_type:complete
MLNWMDILKLDQISISSSALDTRELPEEEEDNECCMKAADFFVNLWNEEFDQPEFEWRKRGVWEKKLTVQLLIDTIDDRNRKGLGKWPTKTTDDFCVIFREILEINSKVMVTGVDKRKYAKTLKYWEECEK